MPIASPSVSPPAVPLAAGSAAYLAELGLHTDPFPVTPAQMQFFATRQAYQAYRELLHFIERRKGFMLVSAEVGVGKTTLVRHLLRDLDAAGARTALMVNAVLQEAELLAAINRDFGLPPTLNPSAAAPIEQLNHWLLSEYQAGRNCVLIIDDAQNLSVPSLELLRQLSNLETAEHKLIQIVLVGQPELLDVLRAPAIRQLLSRVALHVQLPALTLSETRAYVLNRLDHAGAQQRIQISRAALRRLHHASQGIPRYMNLIMDRCLYGLLQQPGLCIDRRLLDTALAEVSVSLPASSQPSPQRRSLAAVLALVLFGGAALGVSSTAERLPWWADRAHWQAHWTDTWQPKLQHWTTQVRETGAIWLAAAAVPFQDSAPQAEPEPERDVSVALEPLPDSSSSPAVAVIATEPETSSVVPQPLPLPVTEQAEQSLESLESAYPELAEVLAGHTPESVVQSARLPQQLAVRGWAVHIADRAQPDNCQGHPAYPLADGRVLSFYQPQITAVTPVFWQADRSVRQLQQVLIAFGYLADDQHDGVMGPQTAAALMAYQQTHGLPPTGQINAATRYGLSCHSTDDALASNDEG